MAVDSRKMVMAASRETKRSFTASDMVGKDGVEGNNEARTIAYTCVQEETNSGLDNLEIGYRHGIGFALGRLDRFSIALQKTEHCLRETSLKQEASILICSARD